MAVSRSRRKLVLRAARYGNFETAGGMERNARPPATTISTIAVRSGATRIVIALLQVPIRSSIGLSIELYVYFTLYNCNVEHLISPKSILPSTYYFLINRPYHGNNIILTPRTQCLLCCTFLGIHRHIEYTPFPQKIPTAMSRNCSIVYTGEWSPHAKPVICCRTITNHNTINILLLRVVTSEFVRIGTTYLSASYMVCLSWFDYLFSWILFLNRLL